MEQIIRYAKKSISVSVVRTWKIMDKSVIVGVIVAIAALGTAAFVSINLIGNDEFVQAQQQPDQGTPFIVQNTSRSAPDPLPGHETHQLVMVAPPRSDGKIYSGVVTFTASAPVEAVVLHPYRPVSANLTQGEEGNQPQAEPLTAPFGDGKVAISLMKKFTDSPINAGSLPFAGTALALHTLDGTPFTVTYTVDAEAKLPTIGAT
ncbi:MAG: hypothetical protein M3297_14835 [Thermoproteota archaeon]|nr:hypothetical protein [Thermoproteota archaeon]